MTASRNKKEDKQKDKDENKDDSSSSFLLLLLHHVLPSLSFLTIIKELKVILACEDEHIEAASCLLRSQFPNEVGLYY